MSEDLNANISNELICILKEMVPEYNYKSNAFTDDGIYLFMYDFATTLAKSINQDPDSHFVSNSFNYINTVGERNDPDVINIINVGILEILYTEKSLSRVFVAMRLSEKLSVLFHAWSDTINKNNYSKQSLSGVSAITFLIPQLPKKVLLLYPVHKQKT